MEVKELQQLCERMIKIKETVKEYDDEKKLLNAELSKLKLEAVEHLEEHGLKGFDHGHGKISIAERRSVKMVDKYKFFNWLKGMDKLEDVATINAATLNKIYKDEFEMAVENGDVDFLEHGLEKYGVSKPSVFRDIRFLK